MSSFLAVLERQLRDGQMFVGAALLLGVFAWLSAFLPQQHFSDPALVRGIAALLVSTLLLIVATLVLGAGLFSRDVAEGRLGFFLARPITAFGLWCGRLAGVLILLALAYLAVWLPALLVGITPAEALSKLVEWPDRLTVFKPPSAWIHSIMIGSDATGMQWSVTQEQALGSPFLWLSGLAIVLLGGAHVAGTALRVRSAWLAVDVAGVVVATGLLIATANRLVAVGAWGALLDGIRSVALWFAVATFLVGLTQVAIGRSLGRRFHAVGSIALSIALVIIAASTSLRVHALLGRGADDLTGPTRSFDIPAASGTSSARILAGLADDRSGYAPIFVVDERKRTETRVGVVPQMPYPPTYASNGRVLAWRSCPVIQRQDWRQSGGPCAIEWLDLDGEARPTEVTTRPFWGARSILALDRDGRRIAYAAGNTLVVHAMPESATLHAIRLEGTPVEIAYGPDPRRLAAGEVLRLTTVFYRDDRSAPVVRTFVLDEDSGRLEVVDEHAFPAGTRRIKVSPDES